MKRILFIFIVLLVACGRTSNQEKALLTVENGKLTIQPSDTLNANNRISYRESLKSLKIFFEFSEKYNPIRKPSSGVANLPETPDNVLNAIRIVKYSQPKEFEKYLTLIFLKLYSAHLECCHQSYEVRKQSEGRLDKERDPLVYEFNTLIKKYPEDKPIEFISSNIGYEYVKSNLHLLEFKPIKKQVEKIKQVLEKNEKGVFWK